jgi:hypothetical protein
MRYAHIINPVTVGVHSDLYIAQPVSFESMKRASEFSREKFDVKLISANYKEDQEIVPGNFISADVLNYSVKDFVDASAVKKLPLIREILDRAYRNSDEGDFIIYTNVDIAVMPHFYEFVNLQIRNGLEAMIINRRTISDRWSSVSDLPMMYSEFGDSHPGYDCFVFPRSFIPEFVLQNICVGATHIGLALYLNMRLLTEKFMEFHGHHLTFHIGNEKSWKKEENSIYEKHNKEEFEKIKSSFLSQSKKIDVILGEAFSSLKNK